MLYYAGSRLTVERKRDGMSNDYCTGCKSERIDHAVACPVLGRVIAAGKCKRMAGKDTQAMSDYLITQRLTNKPPRDIKLRSGYWPTLADADGVCPVLYVPSNRLEGKSKPVMIYGWRTARTRATRESTPLTDISPRDRYERRKAADKAAVEAVLRPPKKERGNGTQPRA